MKGLLYAGLLAPILLTAGTFAWVWSGERKLVAAITVPPPATGAAPASEDPKVKPGWEVFNAKGCVYCHGANGAGGVKNNNAQGGEIPGLTKVGEGFTAPELKTKILAGVKEIGQADAAGPHPPLNMPAWKGHITDEELDAVVAFLMSMAPKDSGGDEGF